MKQFGKYLSVSLLAGGLFLGGLGLIPPDTAKNSLRAQEREREERHPHIRAAIHELREAKRELREAKHDFKGHRQEAMEACDRAMRELERCLEVDRR